MKLPYFLEIVLLAHRRRSGALVCTSSRAPKREIISVIYGLSVGATLLGSEATRLMCVHRTYALKLSLAVSKVVESALILSH